MIPSFVTDPNPDIYLTNNYLVIDYETTNTDKGNPRRRENSLVYAAWKCGPDHPRYTGRVHGRRGDELSQQSLLRAIEEADFIVAQNTKFEQGWSLRIGVPLESKLWYCTILGAYSIDGNRRRPRDLNSLCTRYGLGTKEDLVSRMIKGGIPPEDIPAPWLATYCKKDVTLTEELFLRQREDLANKGLLGVAYTKNLFTPVLTDIELNGMYLDRDRVLDLHHTKSSELASVAAELASTYGEINFNSPQQVARLVYGELGFEELKDRRGSPIRNKPSLQFPEGVPKTDAGTLATLVASNKRQREFVNLYAKQSKLSKMIGTYLEKFKTAVDDYGGHIHGKFNQTVTQTHRLSSSGPRLSWVL